MEKIDELVSFLKLNSAFIYTSTDWAVDIINTYKSAKYLLETDIREFSDSVTLLPEKIEKIIDTANKFNAEKELEKCEKLGIKIITYLDEEYPESLRFISNPPLVLYVKGNLKELPSVSVVGTRHPTPYGVKYAKQIVSDMARIGLNIVSGLARGIDTVAHKAALNAKGKTYAVIGSGLNRIYPPENTKLADKIAESGGCVLSEYPLDTRPLKPNFPRRNRIISALSFATLVVEGDYNSGAMITARYAVEQGKDVMAIPGSLDNRMSNGPNKLIKEGAYPVRNIKDIIELIPNSELFNINLKAIIENKKDETVDKLSPNARKVYDTIKDNNELTVDELSGITGFPMPELFNYLFELEINELVENIAGKYRIL